MKYTVVELVKKTQMILSYSAQNEHSYNVKGCKINSLSLLILSY